MRSRASRIIGETIGWWGCVKCGSTVSNNHTGPCLKCGGHIGRMVPSGTPLTADLGLRTPLRDFVPEMKPQPKHDWNLTALTAAVVLCFASPMLGASSGGWNAIAVVMALNIWSASVGYYALARVGVREHAKPQGTAHA